MNIIKVRQFNYYDLFNDLNLTIDDNQFIVISGPNNCGKTTLIRILAREIITENLVEILEKPINEYKIETYSKLVQSVIPLEYIPQESTLEEELSLYDNTTSNIEKVSKGLKINKLLKKNIKAFTKNEIVLTQIAISLIKKPKILLLDNIGSYLEEKELINIISFIKEYQKENNMTIIYTTTKLKESLLGDYLYIVDEGKIALEGKPLEVLEKDNIINKIGLDIPFIIDLSVKLRDYDLLEKIELDMDRMVDELWK